MVQLVHTVIAMITTFASPHCSTTARDSSVLGVYVGTTPCSGIIRPLHKISKEPDCRWSDCHCAMVEWKLTLYRDPVTGKPTSYKLTSTNRFIVKQTNMYSQPGTKTESQGKWTIGRGTKTNANAVVYQLNPDKPEISLSLLKLSDNLLHVLDHERNLMIGNEFWSYTLNRVAN